MEWAAIVCACALATACGPSVIAGDPEGGGSSDPAEPPGDTAPSGTTEWTTAATATTDHELDDTGRPLDLGDDCLRLALRGCGVLSVVPGLTGRTPLGEFTYGAAVFTSRAGCVADECDLEPNIASVVLGSDAAALAELDPFAQADETLTILWDTDGFTGPVDTPVPVQLLATRDGMTVDAMAMALLDDLPSGEALGEPFDPNAPAIVSGEVEATAEGWSLSGYFQASYCPRANLPAICD